MQKVLSINDLPAEVLCMILLRPGFNEKGNPGHSAYVPIYALVCKTWRQTLLGRLIELKSTIERERPDILWRFEQNGVTTICQALLDGHFKLAKWIIQRKDIFFSNWQNGQQAATKKLSWLSPRGKHAFKIKMTVLIQEDGVRCISRALLFSSHFRDAESIGIILGWFHDASNIKKTSTPINMNYVFDAIKWKHDQACLWFLRRICSSVAWQTEPCSSFYTFLNRTVRNPISSKTEKWIRELYDTSLNANDEASTIFADTCALHNIQQGIGSGDMSDFSSSEYTNLRHMLIVKLAVRLLISNMVMSLDFVLSGVQRPIINIIDSYIFCYPHLLQRICSTGAFKSAQWLIDQMNIKGRDVPPCLYRDVRKQIKLFPIKSTSRNRRVEAMMYSGNTDFIDLLQQYIVPLLECWWAPSLPSMFPNLPAKESTTPNVSVAALFGALPKVRGYEPYDPSRFHEPFNSSQLRGCHYFDEYISTSENHMHGPLIGVVSQERRGYIIDAFMYSEEYYIRLPCMAWCIQGLVSKVRLPDGWKSLDMIRRLFEWGIPTPFGVINHLIKNGNLMALQWLADCIDHSPIVKAESIFGDGYKQIKRITFAETMLWSHFVNVRVEQNRVGLGIGSNTLGGTNIIEKSKNDVLFAPFLMFDHQMVYWLIEQAKVLWVPISGLFGHIAVMKNIRSRIMLAPHNYGFPDLSRGEIYEGGFWKPIRFRSDAARDCLNEQMSTLIKVTQGWINLNPDIKKKNEDTCIGKTQRFTFRGIASGGLRVNARHRQPITGPRSSDWRQVIHRQGIVDYSMPRHGAERRRHRQGIINSTPPADYWRDLGTYWRDLGTSVSRDIMQRAMRDDDDDDVSLVNHVDSDSGGSDSDDLSAFDDYITAQDSTEQYTGDINVIRAGSSCIPQSLKNFNFDMQRAMRASIMDHDGPDHACTAIGKDSEHDCDCDICILSKKQ